MKLNTKEIAIFGMLGAVMFASKMLMELLPNIHLLGMFIVAVTVVYRKKALYPIYIYVLLNGIVAGFATWWIPYLYIWTVLWAAVMLLPKNMPPKVAPVVYTVVSALHGFGYGVLYAPAQALLFGLNFKSMLAWIAAGVPFDVMHGISNLCCGVLIVPLIKLLKNSEKYIR
jgi:energy-coupling factor transport system substrate-specific component